LAACRAQLVADDLLAGIAVALDRLEHPAWQPEPHLCPICGRPLVLGAAIPRSPPPSLSRPPR
jgi:hypothetical protein